MPDVNYTERKYTFLTQCKKVRSIGTFRLNIFYILSYPSLPSVYRCAVTGECTRTVVNVVRIHIRFNYTTYFLTKLNENR